jgi:hypothetical protein
MEYLGEEALCPSSRISEGSKLLGIRQDDGKVVILPNPLVIDASFPENLPKGAVPEQLFRFVNKCVKSDCAQWTKKGCGIALRISRYIDKTENGMPECSIRSSCRWHMQEGDSICRICPYIITDITAEELDKYFNSRTQNQPL